jgi:hypothetical protein
VRVRLDHVASLIVTRITASWERLKARNDARDTGHAGDLTFLPRTRED